MTDVIEIYGDCDVDKLEDVLNEFRFTHDWVRSIAAKNYADFLTVYINERPWFVQFGDNRDADLVALKMKLASRGISTRNTTLHGNKVLIHDETVELQKPSWAYIIVISVLFLVINLASLLNNKQCMYIGYIFFAISPLIGLVCWFKANNQSESKMIGWLVIGNILLAVLILFGILNQLFRFGPGG